MVGIPFRFDGVLGFNTVARASYNNEHIVMNFLSVSLCGVYMSFFLRVTLSFELNTIILYMETECAQRYQD